MLKLIEEVEHPRSLFGGLVQADVQVRDPPQAQARTELVANEGHGVLERPDRFGPLGRAADDAHPDPGVGQIGGRLDPGHGGEADPGILHVAREKSSDLLPEQLVDPIGPSRHRSWPVLAGINWLAPG